MNNILSKQNQRFLIILETLFFNESASFEELTNICDVSIKTIQDDIIKINEFITPLSIKKITLNEYQLIHKDYISCDFIYSCILSESLEFTILEKIFFEEENYLEDYANSLFISLSTLKRTITRINRQIKSEGFQISTNPVQIIGDEDIICRTMMHFFKEKYIKFEYPFSDTQKELFNELIFKILTIEKKFSNLADLEKLKLIVYTSLIRLQNGHHYSQSNIGHLKIKKILSFLENNSFKQSFEKEFNIVLSEKNVFELLYPMSKEDYIFNQKDLQKVLQKSKKEENKYQDICNFVDDLTKTLDTSLNSNKRNSIILDLFNIQFWTRAKTYLIYNFKHNFLINLERDYPLISHFISEKIKTNPYFKHCEKHEIEEVMYILITHWDNLIFIIQDFYPKFKIGIFMLSDLEHTRFMAKILSKQFSHQFNFETIESINSEESYIEFNKYDIILTNMSNLPQNKFKIISVDLYPSSKDLTKIYRSYINLCKSNFII